MAKSGDGNKFVFYHYDPSLAAAISFTVLFILATGVHIFRLIRRRTWCFIPFVIGGIFEAVGYIGRTISSTESPNWTLGPYVMQSLLILLAPALFAASIYMVLGRIVRLTDAEAYCIVRSTWLTKIIVTGDVFSFLTQSTGGALMAIADDSDGFALGQNVVIAGLCIQLVFFAFFVLVAAIFHYRIRKNPTSRSISLQVPWERQIFILFAVSILIMVRSLFRVVEYVQGNDGELLRTEVYLYIFDAALMFLVMLVYAISYPGNVISSEVQRSKEFPLEEARD